MGDNAFEALVNVVSLAAAGATQSPTQGAVTAGTGGLSEIWAQQVLSLRGVTSTLMVSGFQRTGTAQNYPQLQSGPLPARADREERQSAYLYVKGSQWSFAGALVSRIEEYYTDGATQFANPALKPEVLTSEQVSWSRKWSPQFNSHAAVMLFRGEHAIFPVNGESGEQFVNAPDPIKGTAAELELAWHHGGTELSAGGGWYDWTYQGAQLSDSSRWLAVFKAIQRAGDWSLAGEARYVAGRQNTDPTTAVLTTVPANWTLRASVRREWRHAWAQVSGEDLTNSRRRDLVAPEYAPITWMAADGRAVRATLGARF